VIVAVPIFADTVPFVVSADENVTVYFGVGAGPAGPVKGKYANTVSVSTSAGIVYPASFLTESVPAINPLKAFAGMLSKVNPSLATSFSVAVYSVIAWNAVWPAASDHDSPATLN